jgi:hypothetical protein
VSLLTGVPGGEGVGGDFVLTGGPLAFGVLRGSRPDPACMDEAVQAVVIDPRWPGSSVRGA